MKKPILIIVFICFAMLANAAYPPDVAHVLNKAGKNRAELEKAIEYYKKAHDPLKLRAIYFLIGNMDTHDASNYYWADAKGNKIPFDEFSYKDFAAADKAAMAIPAKYPGAHRVPVTVADCSSIKAGFLIAHIDRSFQNWKASKYKDLPFESFCEYILPYRVSVEPAENWLPTYSEKFKYIPALIAAKGQREAITDLTHKTMAWFEDTYEVRKRQDPLPRLGAQQLLFRKAGPCEDIADLAVFMMRSQAIPAALDIIPYWGTSTGTHFTSTIFDEKMHETNFDLSRVNPNESVPREPGKVIRMTYSRQTNVPTNFDEAANIPDGFMKRSDYKDVTASYWQTTDVSCILTRNPEKRKVAYAYVLNGLKWRPIWWGKVNQNAVFFQQMSKGVVYLPAFYQDKKMVPAGSPVAVGYNHNQVLTPELDKKINVVMKEESGFLHYQNGKSYKLYYWDNQWKLIGQQVASVTTNQMLFGEVPKNSLLLFVPEYSKGKERPFIILDDGSRKWF